MVTSESDNAGVVFTIERYGGKFLARERVVSQGRVRLTMEKLFVTVLDLLYRVLVVIRPVADIY